MAFQAVPDVAEFRYIYTRGGDFPIINTFYVRNTVVGWTASGLESTITSMQVAWTAYIKPLISSAITLEHIVARDIGAEFGATTDHTVGTAGTRASDMTPGIIATRVMFKAEAGDGPPKAGAIYHCGALDGDVDANSFTTAFVNSLEDAYTALRDSVNDSPASATNAMVIVSRFSGKTLVEQPNGETIWVPTPREEGVSAQVGDVLVRQRVSKQSRRRLKSPLYVT